MKSATADDVARLAGVSRSAVSRTFSGRGFVSNEKREKVLAAARQLDYRPNAMASSLARRQSNLVAIVVNRLPDDGLPGLQEALTHAVHDIGFLPLTVVVAPGEGGLRTLRQAVTYPVHGMIVMADRVQPVAVQGIVSQTRPIVLNHVWSGGDAADTVTIDQRGGIFAMVAELAATGHRTVGYIGGRVTAQTAQERRSVFVEAVAAHGLSLVAEGVGDYTYERAHAETLRIFNRGKLPDALFCASDVTAFAALDALRQKLGRSVPEDISVIGYGGTPSARWGSYNLTTIRPRSEDIIAHVQLLLAEPDETPGRFRVGTVHVPRGTTAPRR